MNIHITKNGQNLGPYTLAEAQQLVASGALEAADWAWYESIVDWIPLQQVPGFDAPAVPHSFPPSALSAPSSAAASSQTVSRPRRPVLVWVICLFYFIFIPLALLSVAVTPHLVAAAQKIQERTVATIQTQLDHTTDPTERDRLLSLQKRFRDNTARMARLTNHGIGYYGFAIFSMLISLAAAILLFILRRSAFPAFIAVFVINLLGAIYNYATMSLPHTGGASETVGIVIGIVCAVLWWGIQVAILFYLWHLSRKGILR
jgi:hypothetical protein